MNDKRLRAVGVIVALFVLLALAVLGGMMVVHAAPRQATTITFAGKELLCRPTDTSITINIVPTSTVSSIEYFYEYGTASGVYPYSTTLKTAAGGESSNTVITGLTPNTRYYYHMKYHLTGEAPNDWVTRSEYSFWTQRAKGSTFTFDITSDAHLGIQLGNATTWGQTMNNVASDNPDFLIDLGDTFGMDTVSTVAMAEMTYRNYRLYFDQVGNSSSIFVSPGNHEQQELWHRDDTGNPATSQTIMGTNAQKKFYPNPVSNSFYSGNTDTDPYLSGDQLKEDYYSWTWGDALFVVIDPFWYTAVKPFTGNLGGGEGTDTGSGDRWDWTLGLTQFNWLKSTLESSSAKYKFIFAHHMVGGSQDYVRGGANPALICEWGGYNTDGTTYAWTTRRSTWGSQTIRDILIANHVTAFFHGHDHQYAHEMRDGIIYESLASAGFSGSGFNIYTTGSGYTIQAMNSPGHLRVTVGPLTMTVQYIATSGGGVNYSYTASPTAAELTSLTADSARGHVRVSWQAASEVDSLGFHVWRATSVNGEREQLTEDFIPGQAPGSTTGGHYQFVDETAQPGLTYYYWVEQMDVSGATQWYGPVSGKASGLSKLPPPRE